MQRPDQQTISCSWHGLQPPCPLSARVFCRSTIGELTSKVSQLEADSSAVDGLRDGIKGIDEAINKARCACCGGLAGVVSPIVGFAELHGAHCCARLAVLHASCNRCAECVTRFGAHCHPLQIKAQEDVLRQQLADMRAKEAEQGSDIPALIQERDECRCVACGSAAAALLATAVKAGCRLGCLLL